MQQRWSQKSVIGMALLLIVPAGLNITVGNSLGVWWAPFPVWMFLLGALRIPLIVSALLPAAAFLAISMMLLRDRPTSRTVALTLLGASCLVHALWIAYYAAEAIGRLGAAYVSAVFGLGTSVLGLAVWQWLVGRRRNLVSNALLSMWFTLLWWSWWATPWVGEAI